MTDHLTEDLEATPLDRHCHQELEDVVLPAGTQIRSVCGGNGLPYRFLASDDGEHWYNYKSWPQPILGGNNG